MKLYGVSGMADRFHSVDEALCRIDWAIDEITRIESPEAWDVKLMMRNLEK